MFVYRAHFMWFFLHYLKQLPGIIIVTFLEELVNFFPDKIAMTIVRNILALYKIKSNHV